MKLSMIYLSLALRLIVFALVVSLAGCKSDSDSAQTLRGVNDQPPTALLTQVIVSDYVIVSSRRIGRTVTEYTLRAIATNTSANRYTNVTATLTSVPSNITIIDGSVAFGTVTGNSDTTSADDFTIEVDLSVFTVMEELIWQVVGTTSGTGGGGGTGSPSQEGIFMSIDNNSAIKGESSSDSHTDWIELLSFTEGSSIKTGNSTGGSTRPSGTLSLDGVTVSKQMDISSPLLRQALVEGDIFTEVKIDIIRSCNKSIYTEYAITLTVSGLTALEMLANNTENPIEYLAFNYSRIETMYTPVGPGCRLEAPIYSYQDAIGIK